MGFEKTQKFAKEIYFSRESEAKNNFSSWVAGTHYNPLMLRQFISILEDEKSINRIHEYAKSLPSVSEWVVDNIIDLDKNKRNEYIIGNVYWRP